MTLDDLLIEQRVEAIRRIDRRRVALEVEARARYRAPGVRQRLASLLAWTAARLDGAALLREARRTERAQHNVSPRLNREVTP